MTTSRSTRSGGSLAIISSASGPDSALETLWPSGVRTASISRRFCAVSSTTRIFDGWLTLRLIPACGAIREHLLGECQHVDRLGDETDEARLLEACPIGLQHRCGQRHDGDVRRRGLVLELTRGLYPVDAGERDVHENEVGLAFPSHDDAVLTAHRLNGAEAVELEHVTSQLHISL